MLIACFKSSQKQWDNVRKYRSCMCAAISAITSSGNKEPICSSVNPNSVKSARLILTIGNGLLQSSESNCSLLLSVEKTNCNKLSKSQSKHSSLLNRSGGQALPPTCSR